MLTRGQMKRIIDRLPDSELRFLSQVMEGMLAVYKLQREAGASVPVGNDSARSKALRPLNDIIEEIDQGRKKDPMREVMITPVKDLLNQINTQPEPESPPKVSKTSKANERPAAQDEQAVIEARRREQQDWTV